MRKVNIIVLVILLCIAITGCSQVHQEIVVKEKPVEVIEVKESMNPEELNYFGNVQPKSIKQLAFTTSGTLLDVFVESGDYVEEGQLLASIDPENYGIAVDASLEQVRAAELDYGKAKESFDYYDELYSDTLSLYQAGAASKSQVDEVELGYEVSKRELSQAASALSQARLKSSLDENQLTDTELIAGSDGYVVDVLNEKNEVISQGYPVVIIRDKDQFIQIGATADDVRKMKVGMTADISIGEKSYLGSISKIHAMPDQSTRTYSVEVDIDTDDLLLLGEMARVYIPVNELNGIWLNIADVLNDGEDFVYIVEDNRAIRKNIEIGEIYNEFVRVSGLDEGDLLITTGSHSVKDGYQVKIIGDQNE